MVLFFSDMHFGRGAADAERTKEAALIDCLTSYADRVDHLYLVGDVFDGYIEYRHLVPKGIARFQGLLARWTDRGVPITYLVGNHDPWHRDYFSSELGVRVVSGALEAEHDGLRVHLAHGDAHASTHSLYAWLRPLLRHPIAVQLYRSLLPADLGLGLARWVSRRLHEEGPDPAVVDALRAHARAHVHGHDTDIVVMGHSHVPALHAWPEGLYINLGNWYERQTFGRLESGTLHLQRWNGTRAVDIEAADAT
ncbi:MAG: UDP-2,3-diacylglucosamine diphosphatase [Salinivenus sp.]